MSPIHHDSSFAFRWFARRVVLLIAAGTGLAFATPAVAGESGADAMAASAAAAWSDITGTLRIELDGAALHRLSWTVPSTAGTVEDPDAAPLRFTFAVERGEAEWVMRDARALQFHSATANSRGAMLVMDGSRRRTIGNFRLTFSDEAGWALLGTVPGDEDARFVLSEVFQEFTDWPRSVQIHGGLVWCPGGTNDCDQVVGRADIVLRGPTGALPDACGEGGAGPLASPLTGAGPDVIVGDLYQTQSFGSTGGISAFSVGTISCNIGSDPLNWFSNTNQHPVIGQNLYRYKNGRFEQIGQSWLKHGFFALSETLCSGPGGCAGDPSGQHLGVGCSDPYSASLNGTQDNLGPRSQVNPFTGSYPYPFTAPAAPPVIGRRLQVKNVDLDPAQNPSALYFVEGQYVTPDDAASGNGGNNASHRRVTVSGGGSSFSLSLADTTVRERPAILAWPGIDPGVVVQNVEIPGDGGLKVAGKATDLGDGFWSYEYAVFNLNADRAVGGLSVPLGSGTTVRNAGFHDVDSHSGEPYSTTDWTITVDSTSISWATQAFSVNQNANALRWGTMYNFRFEANAPPTTATLTLTPFKPGSPSVLTVAMVGPDDADVDCNENGLLDVCDVDCNSPLENCQLPGCGLSADCNGNLLPDECESDSDGDGVPNGCDLCPGFDDALDADGDGVPDGCDLCPGFDDGDDPDGDGAPTACDNCPSAYNPSQADDDSDGIGNFCDPDFCQTMPANEHFDTNPGWTIVNQGATAGLWQWGVPVGGGDRRDPPTDFDGAGACYLTGNTDGDSDVDGGTTRLLSPLYGLANGTATLRYAAWIGTTDTGGGDSLLVEVSGNGGSTWTSVANYTADVSAWFIETIDLSAVLPLSETVQVRFSANDAGTATIMEAGIDAFEIEVVCDFSCGQSGVCDDGNPCTDDVCVDGFCEFTNNSLPCDDGNACTTTDACANGVCVPGPLLGCFDTTCTDCNSNGARDDCEGLPDCNANNIPDSCEFADCNNNGINDVCDIAGGSSTDCDGGPVGSIAAGAARFNSVCVFCHGTDGTGGFGPNLRGKKRDQIRTKLSAPTTHPGGVFPEFAEQDFADLEAFLSDTGGGGRPDRVPDDCQTLADCDQNGTSDGCELASGSQTDTNADGTPDACQVPEAVTADGVRKNRFVSFAPGQSPGGTMQAVRVTSPAFPGWEKWVDVPNGAGVSRLVCLPVFRVWTENKIHVGDADIRPGTTYVVTPLADGFDAGDPNGYGVATHLPTVDRWGDVVGILDGASWTGPNGVVNGIDVLAAVKRFEDSPLAPPLVWVDVDGSVPNLTVNGNDILRIVLAFQSPNYPFSDPVPCP